jgi:hypothetical protein
VTARITPEPPQGSEVVFRLASVDSLRFKDTALDSLVVPVVGDSASAKLWSYAYWGVADLTATYRGPDGDASDRGEVPRDIDDDGIADSWELSPEGGGAMNLGGSYQDQEWDEEASTGTAHGGDDFSKLAEYMGYVLGPPGDLEGGSHFRLKVNRKEFFLLYDYDDSLATEALNAIIQIDEQVGVDAIPYDYGSQSVYVFDRPNGNAASATVYLQAGSVESENTGGIVWDQGQPGPADSLTAGKTYGWLGFEDGALSRIYLVAIQNFWQENSYPESANTLLTWFVPEYYEPAIWGMLFNNKDIDGNPGTNDYVNPFDLLRAFPPHGPFKQNDDYDSIVATLSEEEFTRLVVLHELGHAMGMSHFILYPSPMRSGIGPGKTPTYAAQDLARVILTTQ